MHKVNFSKMTMEQLVSFYNRHSANPVEQFSDRAIAESRCAKVFDLLIAPDQIREEIRLAPPPDRPTMRDSLKLDRTILCLNTGEMWKNAYQLWRDRPDWLTNGQRDRLTKRIYSAAKAGEQIIVEVNARDFILATFPKPAATTSVGVE